jgi:hypothetical protein
MVKRLGFPPNHKHYLTYEYVDGQWILFMGPSPLSECQKLFKTYPDKDLRIVEKTILFKEVNKYGYPKE